MYKKKGVRSSNNLGHRDVSTDGKGSRSEWPCRR